MRRLLVLALAAIVLATAGCAGGGNASNVYRDAVAVCGPTNILQAEVDSHGSQDALIICKDGRGFTYGNGDDDPKEIN